METFKTVNGVPTKIVCYGKHVDDQSNLQDVKHLILIFPGNPGVIEYYKEFMTKLYEGISKKYPSIHIPVWGISHAGHQMDDLHPNEFPSLLDNQHLYNLDGQINHKFEFTKSYIPSHIKVIGIGHSIGCKTWSEVLNKIDLHGEDEAIKIPQVSKCFMLFPTLERMGTTPNGKRFTALLPFHSLIDPFLKLIIMLPSVIHRAFINLYFWGRGVPQTIIQASLLLFNNDIYERVLLMGRCEMDQVKELDEKTLGRNLDKVFLYFSKTDGWCPLEYVDQMATKFPEMKYKVCERGIEHAFVIHHSEAIAETICSLIDITAL